MRVSIREDMEDIGLGNICGEIVATQVSGQIFREPCTTPVVSPGGRCTRHGGLELVKQEKAELERTVIAQRKKIEEELLPKATARILEILNNEEAKDADVINVWKTIMDRIGLAAVQGIVVEGSVQIEAPLDILRKMLQGETPDIVEGHVVE